MKWLDIIPLTFLIFLAVLMAMLPFNDTPHLLEKLRMLADGTLQRPLDIFDLLMHGAPAVLLMIRLYRQFILGNKAAEK